VNEKRSSGAFPPRTGGAQRPIGIAAITGFLLCAMPVFGETLDVPDFNNIGRKGYALWDCAALGLLANEDQELVQGLIENGYQELSVLVEAWRAGALTDENTSDLPIAFRWYLVSGPSVDFSLGYMWAQFAEFAHDETWPALKDANFDAQKELQGIKAGTEFRSKNCALLLE